MKKLLVPIFTEEYAIEVRIGTRKEIIKSAAKYLGQSYKAVENDYGKCRGKAWNALEEVYGNKHPLIVIDSDYNWYQGLSTTAHEASHAIQWIAEYLAIEDKNGEFHAHGISAVLRAVGKMINQKKLPITNKRGK